MRRKLMSGTMVLAGAIACVLSVQARAWGTTKQIMYGAPDDTNVYCNGKCSTNSCCVING